MIRRKQSTNQGFTIVELLVVIVVIGILSVVTIVSYMGINRKAAVATIQSDLKNASTQLGIDNVNNGSYPANEANANNGRGLPKSTGTIYQYALLSGGYCLAATSASAGATYHISSSVGAIESGPCLLTWTQVASDVHTCALTSDGRAYCWGYNFEGGLGINSLVESHVPVPVITSGALSGKTIISIAVSSGATCAVTSDALAYCWGAGNYGQLGNNSTSNSSVPVAVDTSGALSGKTIKSIAAGGSHFCAIASDDRAYCWGLNAWGQLGNNSTSNSSVPVAVDTTGVLSGKTIKSMFPTQGQGHTCAIASDNLVYCWGMNDAGQLGDNSTTNRLVPVAVNTAGVLNGKTAKSIAAGLDRHTCVVASDNLAYCWGQNGNGQLGNNSTSNSSVPVAVNTTGSLNGKTIKSIAPGTFYTCAIASDDQVYCWGYNSHGQHGNNTTNQSTVPVPVSTSGVLNGKTVKSITSGDSNTCVIASDDQVYCWGWNNWGQLGNDSTTNSLIPVSIITPSP